MLNSFATAQRALMRGGCLVILLSTSLLSISSCTTATNRTPTLQSQLTAYHGPVAAERVSSWMEFREDLRQQRTLPELEKVELANAFINALAWRADDENWRVEDYWATPLETLLLGSGDCEDLAIAKYFILLDAGIDEERLRLSYVWHWHNGEREAHVVLAYYPGIESPKTESPKIESPQTENAGLKGPEAGNGPFILDNLDPQVRMLSERNDLEKVYSFNRWNLWLAGDAQKPLHIASQNRLEKWRGVNDRMQHEAEQLLVAIY